MMKIREEEEKEEEKEEEEEEWGRRRRRGGWEDLKRPEENLKGGWEARRGTGEKQGALKEPQGVWYGWSIEHVEEKEEKLESRAEAMEAGS